MLERVRRVAFARTTTQHRHIEDDLIKQIGERWRNSLSAVFILRQDVALSALVLDERPIAFSIDAFECHRAKTRSRSELVPPDNIVNSKQKKGSVRSHRPSPSIRAAVRKRGIEQLS